MGASEAQKRAQEKHDLKRKSLPRFGGRCSVEEKGQLARLLDKTGIKSEKELIFKALNHYEQHLDEHNEESS